jgi:hypothetical protein
MTFMKPYTEYTTVGEWYEGAKKDGYSIPGSLCMDLKKAMKERDLSFAAAFKLFFENGILIQAGEVFIHDLGGYAKLPPAS